MKNYIPHRLIVINEDVQEKENDETFMRCVQMAFDWANKMGLEGKKVSCLTLKKPNTDNFNPLGQQKTLWCKIECEDEDRNRWDKMRELEAIKAVHDLLREDQ